MERMTSGFESVVKEMADIIKDRESVILSLSE